MVGQPLYEARTASVKIFMTVDIENDSERKNNQHFFFKLLVNNTT